MSCCRLSCAGESEMASRSGDVSRVDRRHHSMRPAGQHRTIPDCIFAGPFIRASLLFPKEPNYFGASLGSRLLRFPLKSESFSRLL